MAITKTDDYQYPLTKVKRFTFDELVADEAVAAHVLPPGSIVIAGAIVVVTAWDSATTSTLDIGDEDDPNRYTASPLDLQTAGRAALTLTGHKNAAPTDLLLTFVETGSTRTEGEAYVEFTIVMEDRANEAVT